ACPIVNALGRLLGAHDLRVAIPRAVVHVDDKTSGDARSWYMISRDAKSWVCDCFAYIHYHIAQLSHFLIYWHIDCVLNQTYELTNIIVDVFEYHFQVKRIIVKIEMRDSRL
ncbi:hypothetical protein Tco_1441961, partial [Tanacetum coccineum]